MKIRIFALLLCIVPFVADAETARDETARASVGRVSMAVMRSVGSKSVDVVSSSESKNIAPSGNNNNVVPETVTQQTCREAYRACMDEFCLLSDGEGERCACSSNIEKSKICICYVQMLMEHKTFIN